MLKCEENVNLIPLQSDSADKAKFSSQHNWNFLDGKKQKMRLRAQINTMEFPQLNDICRCEAMRIVKTYLWESLSLILIFPKDFSFQQRLNGIFALSLIDQRYYHFTARTMPLDIKHKYLDNHKSRGMRGVSQCEIHSSENWIYFMVSCLSCPSGVEISSMLVRGKLFG